MSVLAVKQLSFDYPGHRALDKVSFELEKGSITALIGPNGAGKTTLLRCLAALMTPFAGTIHLGDLDVLAHPRLAHKKMGYLSDFFGLYDKLSAADCLRYIAKAHGLEHIEQRIQTTAEQVGISPYLNQGSTQLSRGQRQRLAIAQAIIHQPEFLLLDEPASGLDPEARANLADLFKSLQAQGMTLLVSSHILNELDAYADNMLILRQGWILEHKRIKHSAEQQQQKQQRLQLELTNADPVPQALIDYLHSQANVSQIEIEGAMLRFDFDGDKTGQQALLKQLMLADFPICALAAIETDLQNLYLQTIQGQNDA